MRKSLRLPLAGGRAERVEELRLTPGQSESCEYLFRAAHANEPQPFSNAVFAPYMKGELKVAAVDKLPKSTRCPGADAKGQKDGCHAERDA
jgi:hypothetical protein